MLSTKKVQVSNVARMDSDDTHACLDSWFGAGSSLTHQENRVVPKMSSTETKIFITRPIECLSGVHVSLGLVWSTPKTRKALVTFLRLHAIDLIPSSHTPYYRDIGILDFDI